MCSGSRRILCLVVPSWRRNARDRFDEDCKQLWEDVCLKSVMMCDVKEAFVPF